MDKNSELSFLRIVQENDNSDLGIRLLRNYEFPENTKLLLSPRADMIYTNLAYT